MNRGEDIELDYDDGYPTGYCILDNRDIWRGKCQDLVLRPATLGVWVAMISLPPKWRFREEWLCRELHLGRDALRRTLRELEECGRLERRRYRGSKGEFTGCRWFLKRGGFSSCESNAEKNPPRTENPSMATPTPDAPRTENPSMAISVQRPPQTENPSPAGPSPVNPPRLVTTERAATTQIAPTTTIAVATEECLLPPSSLSQKLTEQVVVLAEKAIRSGLDPQTAQQVLDELECSLRQPTQVRKPMSYAHTLFRRASEGTFVPDGALKVEKERDDRKRLLMAQMQRAVDQRARAEKRANPASREVGLQHLAELGQRLGFFEPSEKPQFNFE